MTATFLIPANIRRIDSYSMLGELEGSSGARLMREIEAAARRRAA